MTIKFKSKSIKEKDAVTYDPEQFQDVGVLTVGNEYIFPMKKVEENSNVAFIGYIGQTETLVIQYKAMKKTPDGYDIGFRTENVGFFYHNVPENVWKNLVKAKSKSNYINKNIKKNYLFHTEQIENGDH